jgi:hypothetical protein
MEYHVTCRCGKQLPVKTEEAGTTIRCACGESVPVPSLSKLRKTAGLGAYESGTIDTIRRMLEHGELPWGETCAESGRPTDDIVQFSVQCEQIHVAKDRAGLVFWVGLIFGPFWLLLAARSKDRENHGRETVVEIPLRVCGEFHRKLARWGSQRKFRRLLVTVPVYARLLEEYPTATIRVDSTWSGVKSSVDWELE